MCTLFWNDVLNCPFSENFSYQYQNKKKLTWWLVQEQYTFENIVGKVENACKQVLKNMYNVKTIASMALKGCLTFLGCFVECEQAFGISVGECNVLSANTKYRHLR